MFVLLLLLIFEASYIDKLNWRISSLFFRWLRVFRDFSTAERGWRLKHGQRDAHQSVARVDRVERILRKFQVTVNCEL